VILHPHPLYGGTMHNKVVSTLARAFLELGLHTLRFNFRGTGASEGSFDHGEGESADLMAVLAWLRVHRPQDERCIVPRQQARRASLQWPRRSISIRRHRYPACRGC